MAARSRATTAPPADGAVRGVPPLTLAPQLCTLVRQPPKGPDWFTEVKFDGYRFLARQWRTDPWLGVRAEIDFHSMTFGGEPKQQKAGDNRRAGGAFLAGRQRSGLAIQQSTR
jgi:hypothetical protein